jgi:hypothetical protein
MKAILYCILIFSVTVFSCKINRQRNNKAVTQNIDTTKKRFKVSKDLPHYKNGELLKQYILKDEAEKNQGLKI